MDIRAARILECYGIPSNLIKGGVGSGRHKSSIEKLEESNFSIDEENKQRKDADKIIKLDEEIKIAEKQIFYLKDSLKNYNTAGAKKDREYHALKGRLDNFQKQLQEKKIEKNKLCN